MRDVIPFVEQVAEMDEIFGVSSPKVIVKCTIFEENNDALEFVTTHRY